MPANDNSAMLRPPAKSARPMGLQKRAVLFGCTVLLLQLAISACLSMMLYMSQKNAERLAHSHRVLSSCSLLSSYFDDALHCVIMALATGDSRASRRFKMLTKNIPDVIKEMQSEQLSSKEDRADVEEISRTAEFILHKLEAIYGDFALQQRSSDEIITAVKSLRIDVYPYYSDLMTVETRFSQRHRKLKSNYSAKSDPNTMFGAILLVILVTNAGFTITTIVVFGRNIVARLNTIAANFDRFAAKEPLLQRQPGDDEIAALDEQFHGLSRSLREATEREEAIFANMPVGLINCTEDGVIEGRNPRALELGAFEGGMHIQELFTQKPTITNLIKDDTKVGHTRLRVASKDGSVGGVPCEVSLARFRHNDQAKLLFALLDISDREQMEQLREDFMNIVSHDIRTPLSSLAVCFDMLADGLLGDLNEIGENYISKGQNQIDRVMKLTEDLLNIARLESGEIQLQKNECQVDQLMQCAVDSVITTAQKRGININVIPSSLTVFADEDRIVQILLNFVGNALKYTASGKNMTLFATESESSVRISVQDQGPGIPEALRSTIFERFKQVSASDQKRGTGLGLAICKLLAQSHGGTVGIDSAEGSGSIFWVELPGKNKPVSS